jgi:hypothetical protein
VPALVLLFLLLSPAVQGADVISLEVEQEDGNYRVSMDAVLAAPMPAVWQRLTDYPQLKVLSPSVSESDVLAELGPTRHRVRTKSRLCVFIFCGDIVQVQVMTQAAVGVLQAMVEPEDSDFEQGRLEWRLMAQQGATRLMFNAELRPDFIVPPLIGPWAIKRVLREEALVVVTGLERLAGEGQ